MSLESGLPFAAPHAPKLLCFIPPGANATVHSGDEAIVYPEPLEIPYPSSALQLLSTLIAYEGPTFCDIAPHDKS